MKAVAEILAAIILLATGSYLAPHLIKEFKTETIIKLNQGQPSLEKFSKELTKK